MGRVTYINCYDENGQYLDRTKRLDEEITTGYMITRYPLEGEISWEILEILKEEQLTNSTNKMIDVKVKQHPYVKTYCKHEWVHPSSITELLTETFVRKCTKCDLNQKFNIAKAKWE